MGTKRNPGRFDCYAAAGEDEPMFILLGRDPMAPLLVRIWARLREESGGDPAKVAEAMECAEHMEKWSKDLGKTFVRTLLARVIVAGLRIVDAHRIFEDRRGVDRAFPPRLSLSHSRRDGVPCPACGDLDGCHERG
jgi:hypothetical protein